MLRDELHEEMLIHQVILDSTADQRDISAYNHAHRKLDAQLATFDKGNPNAFSHAGHIRGAFMHMYRTAMDIAKDDIELETIVKNHFATAVYLTDTIRQTTATARVDMNLLTDPDEEHVQQQVDFFFYDNFTIEHLKILDARKRGEYMWFEGLKQMRIQNTDNKKFKKPIIGNSTFRNHVPKELRLYKCNLAKTATTHVELMREHVRESTQNYVTQSEQMLFDMNMTPAQYKNLMAYKLSFKDYDAALQDILTHNTNPHEFGEILARHATAVEYHTSALRHYTAFTYAPTVDK